MVSRKVVGGWVGRDMSVQKGEGGGGVESVRGFAGGGGI